MRISISWGQSPPGGGLACAAAKYRTWLGVRTQGQVAYRKRHVDAILNVETYLMRTIETPFETSPTAAPVARRNPVSTPLHGTTLEDAYGWMRDKSSSEVIAYLEAENTYTNAAMAPTAALQEKLYGEMLSHIKETDESVPYRMRGWFYCTRTVAGLQYPIHCRRAAVNGSYEEGQPEEILLDVNQLAEGQPFMAVGTMAISADDQLLAYSPGPPTRRRCFTPPRMRSPSATTIFSATPSARQRARMPSSTRRRTNASTWASAKRATASTS
jgi:hypothetical protein